MFFSIPVFFGALACLSLAAIFSRYRVAHLYRVLKTMPVLLLLGFTYATLSNSRSISGTGLLILAALVMSMLGDLLLLNARSFLLGLVAFLGAHVLYILILLPSTEFAMVPAVLLLIYFLMYGYFLLRRLYEFRKVYIAPVLIYFIMICVFVLVALNQTISPLISIGAILFLISDSILAYDRFIKPFYHAQFLILLTYYGAQSLIVFGLLNSTTGG